MALKTIIKNLKKLMEQIAIDLNKAEQNNKSAAKRVRTGTIEFTKQAKQYRKESIESEKSDKKQ